MRLYYRAANGKSQTDARRRAFTSSAFELVEDGFFASRRQARTDVVNAQDDAVGFGVSVDVDRRSRRGVFAGILQHVDQHALHQHRVELK